MYDSRLRLARQIYDEVKRHFQELVFKAVIQRNVKLSESPSHGYQLSSMMLTLQVQRIILALQRKSLKRIRNKKGKDTECKGML